MGLPACHRIGEPFALDGLEIPLRLAPENIRVNAVCPGWTEVPRTAPKLRDPDTLRRIAATMALPKVAQPEDIANAYLFLASDEAGFISGEVLRVDGGIVIGT